MKKLYLVRHAKSSWKNPGIEDFSRPLNSRGKRDAPFMAKLLKQKNEIPELIISSPAKRAKKTAEAFSNKLSIEKNKIIYDENIYEASSNELKKIITQIDNSYSLVMLFGHNPGLTSISNQLCNKYIDNIPTCGIVAIKFETDWTGIPLSPGIFLFFEYPKLYFK